MRETLTKEHGQVGRFFIVGGIGVGTYFTSLIGLTELGLYYMASAVVAFGIYITVHFLLHKFWTFKNKSMEYMRQQFVQFLLIAIVNWIVNTGGMYLWVEYGEVPYWLAQGILTAIVSVPSYILFRWIFRHH